MLSRKKKELFNDITYYGMLVTIIIVAVYAIWWAVGVYN
jgi:hypothetical protein